MCCYVKYLFQKLQIKNYSKISLRFSLHFFLIIKTSPIETTAIKSLVSILCHIIDSEHTLWTIWLHLDDVAEKNRLPYTKGNNCWRFRVTQQKPRHESFLLSFLRIIDDRESVFVCIREWDRKKLLNESTTATYFNETFFRFQQWVKNFFFLLSYFALGEFHSRKNH